MNLTTVIVGGGADSRGRKMFLQLWVQGSGTHPLVYLRINWQEEGGRVVVAVKATWMLGPIPRVSDSGGLEGALKSAFLTSSQVKLVQLFQEPHPENH